MLLVAPVPLYEGQRRGVAARGTPSGEREDGGGHPSAPAESCPSPTGCCASPSPPPQLSTWFLQAGLQQEWKRVCGAHSSSLSRPRGPLGAGSLVSDLASQGQGGAVNVPLFPGPG